jgi:protein TonB
MTWGIRQPLVLVPEGLAALPPKQREAVYVHEFLHVARRDVLAVWLEEAIRTALCLHPAVWIVSSRVRLAREQVVDAETVALTAARRPYLEALLWCADAQAARTAHALPFFTRHHLLTRMASLTTEVPMSRVRTVLTTGALTAVFAAGSLALASVAPLPSASQAQAPDAEEPGPLERVAVLPTLDVPAPRRTVAVNPFWPAEAVAEGMAARYRMHVVVDAAGAVGEARIITQVAGHAAAVSVTDGRAAQRALRQAALDAVRQWQFELPAVAPMMLVTEVTVGDLMTASSPDAPVQVGGDVRAPRKVHDVPPVYPQVAQDAKVQGVVIMEVVLERTGDVSDVRVLRSIPLLDAAAIDAVRQWKYEPSADRLRLVLTINFALQP